jgi:hypothetical protein
VNCSNLVAGPIAEVGDDPVIPVDLMLAIGLVQYAGFPFSMLHYDDLVLFVDAEGDPTLLK